MHSIQRKNAFTNSNPTLPFNEAQYVHLMYSLLVFFTVNLGLMVEDILAFHEGCSSAHWGNNNLPRFPFTGQTNNRNPSFCIEVLLSGLV